MAIYGILGKGPAKDGLEHLMLVQEREMEEEIGEGREPENPGG